MKCSHCERTGHGPDNCWVKHPDKTPSWIKDKAKKAAKLDGKSGPDRSSTPYGMMALTHPLIISDWVIDTGASKHTCNDIDRFETIDLSPGLPSVLTAAGPIAPIGCGTVKLDVSVPTGTRQLIIRNVLFMPTFPCNLFSALELLLKGGRICTKTMAIFDAKDALISKISVSQEGLKLRLAESGHPSHIALLANTRPRALPIRLWHLRMGHRSIQDIRKTALAVRGMKLDDPDPTSDLQCHSCELSKSHLQINRALRKILD